MIHKIELLVDGKIVQSGNLENTHPESQAQFIAALQMGFCITNAMICLIESPQQAIELLDKMVKEQLEKLDRGY